MEELLIVAGAIMVGMGAIGGAVGVGVAASKYLEGIARQPELQGYLLGQFFIMMALEIEDRLRKNLKKNVDQTGLEFKLAE